MDVNETLQAVEAVCMDVDLTLVEYKLNQLIRLDYTANAKTLVNLGYSQDLLDPCWLENIEKFACQGLVADLKNGFILKLNEDYTIERGYYGIERLTHEQLVANYGNPPKFDLNTPEEFYKAGVYSTSHTYFSVGSMYLYQIGVELFKGRMLGLDDISLWGGEVRKAIIENYSTENPYDSKTFFYPEVNDNPSKFIERRDDILEALVRLKNRGKKLVIITNGLEHYCNLVMAKSFGEDWHELFDLIIANALKPSFFASNQAFEQPSTSIAKGRYKLKGCAKLIEEELKTSNILFCGDHALGDMYAPKHLAGWKVAGVLKELYFEKSISGPVDKKQVLDISTQLQEGLDCLQYTANWGSFFGDENKQTLWWAWMDRYTDFIGSDIIKLLDNIP
jgi:HAD superfamily 5'-nucleotidase-like hydrolase